MRLPRLAVFFIGGILLAQALGCAGWGYDRITIGADWNEAKSLFPQADVQKTDAGVCVFSRNPFGEIDAIVILLTRDQRIAGKLRAVHREESWGFAPPKTRYAFEGEISVQLLSLGNVGPIDALRALAMDLSDAARDKQSRDAHGWVAAGIVRLLQRWPQVQDEGSARQRFADMLDQIPGGGEASIAIDMSGAIRAAYRFGALR